MMFMNYHLRRKKSRWYSC